MDITDLELNVNETNTERFQKLHSKTLGFKYNKTEKQEIKTKQKTYVSDVIFLTRILTVKDTYDLTEEDFEGQNIHYSLEYKWFKMASAFERVLLEDGMPAKVNKVYTFDDDLPWTDEIKKKLISVGCALEKVVTKEYLKGTKLIHKTAAKGLTCLEHAKSYFKVDKYRQGLGLMLEAMQYYGMLTIQLRDLETQVGRAQLEYGKNNNGGKKPSLRPIANYVQIVIDNYLQIKPKASNEEVYTFITKNISEDNKLENGERTDIQALKAAIIELNKNYSANGESSDLKLKDTTLRLWKKENIISL